VELWALERPWPAAVAEADDEHDQCALDEDEDRARDREQDPVDVLDSRRLR
jgi:hypothetical protein